jgi:hypothetical protein
LESQRQTSGSEDFVEHRDDLSKLLLDGLPSDEREHVIDVIKHGDAERLRRKRAEKSIPAQESEAEAEYADAGEGSQAVSD